MLLRSARLADGRLVDVILSDGRITAVTPAGSSGAHRPPGATAPDDGPGPGSPDGPATTGAGPTAAAGREQLDLTGYLLLPAPAEPHAHLDKALSADQVPNPAGDLLGAIDAWVARYPDRTVEEITERARRAVLRNLTHGVTAVRTHIDVNEAIGLRGVEALVAVRDELRGTVDLQLVALAGRPLTGPEGAANRRLLAAALDLGVDVGGGCPHVDDDSAAHLDHALEAAALAGRPLDLHLDEHLDADRIDLHHLVHRITTTGFPHGAVASHCTSLGMQPPEVQADLAARLADTGISVVTLPHTNLYLQGRGHRTAQPRGLTAVAALLDAGVNLAAGGDNLQDPFNPMGRGDPLETASLLVLVAHTTPEQAYRSVSAAARHAMGLEPVEIAVGSPADLLAVRAGTLREAIASAPPDRVVIKAGRVVARTSTTTVITP